MNAHWEDFRSELKGLVVEGGSGARSYGEATTGTVRGVIGAAMPTSAAEVERLVRSAARHHVAVYPVSTGKNWGYGSAGPATDTALVIDLSKMTRIIHLDRDLGTVTIEPGVTQALLAAYLDANAPEFLVPVTGAGPDVSLLGNALERGYGITPHTDHFAAVTRVRAVLPDGQPYVSALEELGGATVSSVFRWGIGPYLNGLFSQGSLGIVTEATLLLARRPERIEGFFFQIEHDAGLEAAVTAVRQIMRECGGCLGGINLLDTTRMLAMRAKYPEAEVPYGETMTAAQLQRLATEHGVPAWTGFGGLYGTAEMVAGARGAIRRALRGVARRLQFATSAKLATAASVLKWVPGARARTALAMVSAATETVRILEGRPSEVALPLAYWRSRGPAPAKGGDPERDGCGLLWHAPLVPMRPSDARKHVELVRATAHQFGLEAPITLTALSAQCFDSTVPLLFDRTDAATVKRARACQQTLLERGCAEGFVPYRLGTHQMSWFCQHAPTSAALIDRLASSVDAEHLMSPGRYRPSVTQTDLHADLASNTAAHSNERSA